jgi:hypothetical protein
MQHLQLTHDPPMAHSRTSPRLPADQIKNSSRAAGNIHAARNSLQRRTNHLEGFLQTSRRLLRVKEPTPDCMENKGSSPCKKISPLNYFMSQLTYSNLIVFVTLQVLTAVLLRD